jgi:putative membrane protein
MLWPPGTRQARGPQPLGAETMNPTIRFWVLQTLAMMITAFLIPGLRITSILGTILIVVALALVNATVWDAALFFSLPASATAEALVLVLANGAIFWLLVKFLPGIEVRGILAALASPIVFTLVNMLLRRYALEIDFQEIGREVIDAIEQLRDWLYRSRTAGTTTPGA